MARRFRWFFWTRDRDCNQLEPAQTWIRSSWRFICLFLVVMGLSLVHHWLPFADASPNIQPPLSTKGARIVDATGQTVLLRGVNWFGMETELQVPHGLWVRDYKEMLAQIKSLGYNFIRLPYSVQALRSNSISGVDFSIGSNKDLQGKTPLEAMDIIVQEAQRQGLLILLDSHRLNNERIPELWYGDGFTEADWIDTWKLLATRYRNQPNVIGADLKNEPYGRASWGTNDLTTDWRLAAERAGNAILALNPNWLIVVEGVEKNVPGQKLAIHWKGGNLEGVAKYPVRLRVPRKLVYSPHEYGPGVFNQPWFREPSFPNNLRARWETGFYYIVRRNLAPVLIGEFGGRQVDASSKEGIWQRQLVSFIQQKQMSFAYWSWNPNSSDTGGILLDDWTAIDQPKQQLLNQLLPVPGMQPTGSTPIAPSPLLLNPSPPPNPLPNIQPQFPIPSQLPPQTDADRGTLVPASAKNLRAEATIQSDWQTGFCVDIRVTNLGNTPSRRWQLSFRMNQAAISQTWNGIFIPQGSQYRVEPPDWAQRILPNQAVNLGFCAQKLGPDYQPKQLLVS